MCYQLQRPAQKYLTLKPYLDGSDRISGEKTDLLVSKEGSRYWRGLDQLGSTILTGGEIKMEASAGIERVSKPQFVN